MEIVDVAEGPSLVMNETKGGSGRTRFVSDVVGKNTVDVRALKRLRHVFDFPAKAVKPNVRHHLRLSGNQRGLLVCPGPHLI